MRCSKLAWTTLFVLHSCRATMTAQMVRVSLASALPMSLAGFLVVLPVCRHSALLDPAPHFLLRSLTHPPMQHKRVPHQVMVMPMGPAPAARPARATAMMVAPTSATMTIVRDVERMSRATPWRMISKVTLNHGSGCSLSFVSTPPPPPLLQSLSPSPTHWLTHALADSLTAPARSLARLLAHSLTH